jgi:CBS domain-containing protein
MSSSPAAVPAADAAIWRAELAHHAPFVRMTPAGIDAFIAAAQVVDYGAGEHVLGPQDGPVQALLFIRSGAIIGRAGTGLGDATAFAYEDGDIFPVGALMGRRPVQATYRATAPTTCLHVPAQAVDELAAREVAFADFLHRRVQQFLDLSQKALQADVSSQALAEQSLEAPLQSLPRKQPLACTPATALADALGRMHERRVGSVLVTDAAGEVLGILTRHDILGRVTLPGVPLTTPIESVMSHPVHTLDVSHTLQDAALVMSRHGVRHVPITEDGKVVSIVSERDLFSMQRKSLKQLGSQLRTAGSVESLRHLSRDIPRFARSLVAQGVGARSVTRLISHLNDLLTERLVGLIAQTHGLDPAAYCWLSFGSEGRGEQTIATDQDNGLVFASDDPTADRARWLAFGNEVNQALDACGYPLCKGGIMAGQAACCLTAGEWQERFEHWIEHGAPQDLLNASIYFDLRPLAGNAALAAPLREFITRHAKGLPRFARQLAENAMRNRAPINWLGNIDTTREGGRDGVDLKLHGTALFVDVARLYALNQGVDTLGTRERLEAVAPLLKADTNECATWVGAFEILQMLRLRRQMADAEAPAPSANPNWIALDALNGIDRHILKEALRIARRLQQRMELDWLR